MTEDLHRERARLEGEYADALQRQSESKSGTPDYDKARGDAAQVASAIANIDAHLSSPESFEETVTLVASSGMSYYDSTIGAEFKDGRAEVPRSLAERLSTEFEGYSIETSGARKKRS